MRPSVTPPRPLSAFTVRELTGRRRALERTLDTLPVTGPGHRRFSRALEAVLAGQQRRATMARAR